LGLWPLIVLFSSLFFVLGSLYLSSGWIDLSFERTTQLTKELNPFPLKNHSADQGLNPKEQSTKNKAQKPKAKNQQPKT
jgi:hypothetical protein